MSLQFYIHSAYPSLPHYLGAVADHSAWASQPVAPFYQHYPSIPTVPSPSLPFSDFVFNDIIQQNHQYPYYRSRPAFPSIDHSNKENVLDDIIRENNRKIASLLKQRYTSFPSPSQRTPAFPRTPIYTDYVEGIVETDPERIIERLTQKKSNISSAHRRVPQRGSYRSLNPDTYIPPIVYPRHYPKAERLIQKVEESPLLSDEKPLPGKLALKMSLWSEKGARWLNERGPSDRLSSEFHADEHEKIRSLEAVRRERKHYKDMKKGIKKGRVTSFELDAKERKVRHHLNQAQISGKSALRRQIEETAPIYQYTPGLARGLGYIIPKAPTRVRVRQRNGRERRRIR
jgi:hypothetical protein